MKVILIKNVIGKGKINDIIEVSDGYAKNYLIKKKFAVPTTSYNLRKLNNILLEKEIKAKVVTNSLEKIKKTLEQLTLNFKLKVYEKKIFGSISMTQIKDCLEKEFNLKIDKKKFINNNNLTCFGLHYLKIKLNSNLIATLKVMVEKKEN